MQKAINIIVKVAGLIICVPVTLGVAGELFADVQPEILRYLVQLAALAVVEGVFLSAWWSLDADRNAPPEVKTRYAMTAGVMYIGLWVLAWYHGEGLAGLVFRAALGLALLGSVYDSGVYTAIASMRATDRDISKDRQVAKHARNLARRDAIADLDAAHTVKALEREASTQIATARVNLDRQRGMSAVKAEHAAASTTEASPRRFPYPVARARSDKSRKNRQDRGVNLDRTAEALAVNPKLSYRELGDVVGVSHETARRLVEQLEQDGRIAPREVSANNGNGHKVAA